MKTLGFYCVCHPDIKKGYGFIAFAIGINPDMTKTNDWFYWMCHPFSFLYNFGFIAFASGCNKNVGFIAFAIRINKNTFVVWHPDKQKGIGSLAFAIQICDRQLLALLRLPSGYAKQTLVLLRLLSG